MTEYVKRNSTIFEGGGGRHVELPGGGGPARDLNWVWIQIEIQNVPYINYL